MEMWADIRRRVMVDGESKRSVLRHYGIHWKTLRKILGHSAPPGYRLKEPRGRPKIEAFLPIIEQILEADKQAPRKQYHTVRQIHKRLCHEYQFTGGYTIVREAVNACRVRQREVFVPLSHPMGEAQVDFGFAEVVIDGEQVKVALFVMTLPYSDGIFVKAYPRECTEAFIDGHVQAFKFFGGVPLRISYDNSKIAVAEFVGSRGRKVTVAFQKLVSHFLFSYHFCLVRRPNEKGHVETLVKFSRSNFLVPVPHFGNFEALNASLEQQCQTDLLRQLRGKPTSKEGMLAEERKVMLPSPKEEYEARKVVSVTANSLSLARFDNNDYSVPTAYAHHPVTVVATVDEVSIVVLDQVVARHRRCWKKGQVFFNPIHYLALLERKPGAFSYARPLEGWKLPECLHTLRRLLESEFDHGGTRQFIKVLRLLERWSLDELSAAVTQALDYGTVDADAVRLTLEGLKEPPAKVFNLDGHSHLSHVNVSSPNLSAYEGLREEVVA